MGNIFQFPWEVSLITWLQEVLSNIPLLKHLLITFTFIGEPYLTVLIVLTFYWSINKETGFLLGTSIIGSGLMNNMIKNIFSRVRPYAANDTIECIVPADPGYDIYNMTKQGYSFPSGHATNAGALTTSIYLSTRKKIYLILGLIVTAIIALSRVSLGVHYPTDVSLGALIGIIATIIIYRIYHRFDLKTYAIVMIIYSLCGVFFCHSNDYFSNLGLMIGLISGYLFEEKMVNFEQIQNPVRIILRSLIGCLIFLAISNIMKLPFSETFLEADIIWSHLYRSFRYGLSTFVIIGLYPILFKYNLFRFKDKKKEDS